VTQFRGRAARLAVNFYRLVRPASGFGTQDIPTEVRGKRLATCSCRVRLAAAWCVTFALPGAGPLNYFKKKTRSPFHGSQVLMGRYSNVSAAQMRDGWLERAWGAEYRKHE
jgi:hypothetical protein